jgi:hypothetical protein
MAAWYKDGVHLTDAPGGGQGKVAALEAPVIKDLLAGKPALRPAPAPPAAPRFTVVKVKAGEWRIEDKGVTVIAFVPTLFLAKQIAGALNRAAN